MTEAIEIRGFSTDVLADPDNPEIKELFTWTVCLDELTLASTDLKMFGHQECIGPDSNIAPPTGGRIGLYQN